METPAQKGARNVEFMKRVLDENEKKLKWNSINYFRGSASDLVVQDFVLTDASSHCTFQKTSMSLNKPIYMSVIVDGVVPEVC